MFSNYKSFRDFARSVRHHSRYLRTTEQLEFLESVYKSSIEKHEVLPAGSRLWRAQIGNDWRKVEDGGEFFNEEIPFPRSRMVPLAHCAKEGRVNPKGIPRLYTATNEETAVAEVRPWVGTTVSLGLFELVAEQKVVNFTTDDHSVICQYEGAEPTPDQVKRTVWQEIDRAFSEPTERSDELADYAPTQVVAEFFASKGFNGVAYRSALGPGHNVAFFDLSAAQLCGCRIVRIHGLGIQYRDCGNAYGSR